MDGIVKQATRHLVGCRRARPKVAAVNEMWQPCGMKPGSVWQLSTRGFMKTRAWDGLGNDSVMLGKVMLLKLHSVGAKCVAWEPWEY